MKIKVFKLILKHFDKLPEEINRYYKVYGLSIFNKKYKILLGIIPDYIHPFYIRRENNDIEFDIQINYFWFNIRFYYTKVKGE
jgi:hypothetical protein